MMGAKGTVMNYDKILDKFGVTLNEDILNCSERLNAVAKAQAEISFTAGYEQSVLDNDNWSKDGYRRGIREVVGFVEENIMGVGLDNKRWHAQKKIWGIK